MTFVDPEERISKIKEVVQLLNTRKERVSIRGVAKYIGISSVALLLWLRWHGIDPTSLGIPPKKVIDKEKRIAEIEEAVKELQQKDCLTTLSNVEKELNLCQGTLSMWSKKNIDLERLGIFNRNKLINISRPIKIEEAIKKLRLESKEASAKNVAKELDMTSSSLLNWLRKHNFDFVRAGGILKPHYLRFISSRERISKIKKIVRDLRKEELVPHTYNIAARLGLNNRTLFDWYRSRGIKRETLGVVCGQVDSNRRILRIKYIVESLKKNNRMPNLAAVSKELGITSTTMVVWARRNKIDLKSLGVVWGIVKKNNVIRLENKIFFGNYA